MELSSLPAWPKRRITTGIAVMFHGRTKSFGEKDVYPLLVIFRKDIRNQKF